jgi:hypothetical protein
MALPVLTAVLPIISQVVARLFPDPDEARRVEADLTRELITAQASALDAAQRTIVAEAQGESWLQRNWRPLLMLCFTLIVFNNYVGAPYARAFGLDLPTLELPDGAWALLNIGVGGYIAGRTAEKVMGARQR